MARSGFHSLSIHLEVEDDHLASDPLTLGLALLIVRHGSLVHVAPASLLETPPRLIGLVAGLGHHHRNLTLETVSFVLIPHTHLTTNIICAA